MLEKYYWELLAKKLAGEASFKELEELEQLAKMYPHLHKSVPPLESFWQTGVNTGSGMAEEKFDELWLNISKDPQPNLNERSQPSPYLSKRKKWFRMAAAAILLLGAGLTLLQWATDRSNGSSALRIDARMQTRQFFCPAGSKTKIVLPDSSTVWLNSGSRITYNDGYGISNRDLTLTGEAFFDVRKSLTPFVIKTANIQIKVLGTAFNVRAYPHEKRSETSLIRGSVEITLDERPNERIVLKPSEKIVVKHDAKASGTTVASVTEPLIVLSVVTNTPDSSVAETSWMETRMVFRSETFNTLARRMEGRYGVQIIFRDERLRQQRFTGAFTDESVTEAPEALQYSHPFYFTIHDNVIEVSDK